jgi:hypothetical protein
MLGSSHEKMRKDLFEDSEGDASSLSKRDVNPRDRERELLQARQEMQTELHRMRSTAAVIDDTSRTIGTVKDKYNDYKTKLASAANRLKELKSKMESDDKYIYYSFIFFLTVSGYVFLKRVKVIAITQWFALTTYRITGWVFGSVMPSTTSTGSDYNIPTTTTTTTTGWTPPRRRPDGRPEREYAPTTPRVPPNSSGQSRPDEL